MSAGTVQCTLNAIGNCAHDYTALPGDVVDFQLFIQNTSTEDCEYTANVRPPIAVPADAIGEPVYEYFNGGAGTLDDCLVVPCGGCVWVTWSVTIPEDLFCKALTLCVELTKKSDETETIVKKNLKTGVAQVEVPVKLDVKRLTSQTIAVGVNAEDLKSCPDSNGRRSNDTTAIQQWMTGAWNDCDAATMLDACDSGYSFLEFITSILTGAPLPELLATIDKNAVGEAIQGVDLNEDGVIGGVTVGSDEPDPLQAKVDGNTADELRAEAEALGLSTSGTKLEIAQRIIDAA